ncbi:hypothetical protein LCGC14_0809540 [marine sediment metagenome]|uniref:Uncharacterized protein n=1 Tax=marine sediment metagenome TaxID=412755 RepID=A0A0F9PRS7_9ZZZZ
MCSGKKDAEFLIGFFFLIIIFLVFLLAVSYCFAAPPDEVAVDLAIATMVKDEGPAFNCLTCKDTGWIVHGDGNKTKCFTCNLASLPGGPLDIFKQAKELIHKGNKLADRGKKLLDAVQRDGKISVDILLPFEAGESPSIMPSPEGVLASPVDDCPVGST